MSTKKDKILKSEFEQKLEESRLKQERDHDLPDAPPVREETIPVIEEEVHIDKEVVESGRVHISKEVHEEEVDVDIPMMQEEVDVKRVAKNIQLDAPPPPVRYEGDVMIIPVLREVVVVEKRLVLVEELHVTKKEVQTHDKQRVTLRKEEVHVNRTDGEDNNPNRA